jgi:hypothetical protein
MTELIKCSRCSAQYTPGDWVRGYKTFTGGETTPGDFHKISEVPKDSCPVCLKHKDAPGPVRWRYT